MMNLSPPVASASAEFVDFCPTHHYYGPMRYAPVATVLMLASPVFALDGQVGIHDPSTIVQCDGKLLHLRHRRHFPGVRRRLDLAPRGHARAQRNGPRRHSRRRPLLPVCRREHRGAAQSRHQHDLEQDARPGFARLQMGGRRRGRLVRRRRGLQRHRSGRLSRSQRRQAVADLRLLFRLHPARRARSQDRQAPQPERQAASTSRSTAKPPS